MIAVIKGDIVASRKVDNPEKWLKPLKGLLSQWGRAPKQWELVWGDFFQLEIKHPEEALSKAFAIKSMIKSIVANDRSGKISPIDVRMAIGIGEKIFTGKRISESNGSAFVFSGERFDKLKKEKVQLALQSPWFEFDQEMNLYLKLAGIIMDKWSVSSAELISFILQHPDATQEEIGETLGIKQNSVSGRWGRARGVEILEIEKVFRDKLKQLIK